MKNNIDSLSRKEVKALGVSELSEVMRPVFRESEKKRRWLEVDNEVKIINGKKPSFIKEDEFSFITDFIFSAWEEQYKD